MRMSLKEKLHEVVFEAETPAGKAFDVILLIAILTSIGVVILESVPSYRERYGQLFFIFEWIITIAFTVEYLVRLYCVRRPVQYAVSAYGIIDFFSLAPTYLSVIIPGAQSLIAIRALRLLRVFRILKLVHFVKEANVLWDALAHSRHKITIFFGTVLTLVLIMGTTMYLIEGAENGFTSIPLSIYWAIVTMTTVGYGDLTPKTTLGMTFSSFIMILGYAIIAVPTGIVSSEIAQATKRHTNTISCPSCTKEGHNLDASYCRFCGAKL